MNNLDKYIEAVNELMGFCVDRAYAQTAKDSDKFMEITDRIHKLEGKLTHKAPREQVEELRELYPAPKTDAQSTRRYITKAIQEVGFEPLKEAVQAYAEAVATWRPESRTYVPKCRTWFSERKWEDDREEWYRNSEQPPQKQVDILDLI